MDKGPYLPRSGVKNMSAAERGSKEPIQRTATKRKEMKD